MANRNVANRTLAVVFIAFIITAVVKSQWRDSMGVQLLYIILEAALIGGVADWFAVTALFEKPLGIPWHTALIPRNRSRIVTGIVNTVQNELMSKQAIKNRLQQVRFVDMLLAWGDQPRGKRMIGAMAAKAVSKILAKIAPDELIPQLEAVLKKYLQKTDMTPVLKQASEWALRTGKHDEFIVFLLQAAGRQAAEPDTRRYIQEYLEHYLTQYTEQTIQDNFFKIFFKNLLESFDVINLEDAATALQTELVRELEAMGDENHSVRIWLNERLAAMVEQLDQDNAIAVAVTGWQHVLIERMDLGELLRQLLEMVVFSARTAEDGQWTESAPLNRWVQEQVERYWELFGENLPLQNWIEKYLKEAIAHLIETEHHLIGLITQRALDVFTEQDLNDFIRDKAGEDLQWIRINGSVVGGIVGLLIFLVQQFAYKPLLLRIGL